eukprot:1192935-Prorocentrum_minimum.AAC.2
MGPHHWLRPGIFPTWVHIIGRGLEYSLHGSTPLAEAWNIPCVTKTRTTPPARQTRAEKGATREHFKILRANGFRPRADIFQSRRLACCSSNGKHTPTKADENVIEPNKASLVREPRRLLEES